MTAFEKSEKPRPAIHKDPLPQAGESLRSELDDQLFGKAMFWLLGAFLSLLWAGYTWCQYLFRIPTTLGVAIVVTVIALAIGVLALVKVPRALRAVDLAKKGIRGEVHVSQYLIATCVPLGYRVFDDVPAEGSGGRFNIDHVLIGPGGVFSIETKNWALPPKGTKAEMVYDPKAGTLTEPDGTRHADATKQARANGDFVRKMLAARTGRAVVFVKPVLMLLGWFIVDSTPRPRPIWILGNETLHQWLREEQLRLSVEEVAALAAELENYVRNFGK